MQELITRKLTFGSDAQVIITVEEEYENIYFTDLRVCFAGALGMASSPIEVHLPTRSSAGKDTLYVLLKTKEALEQAIEWLDSSGYVEKEEA